jgi:hypothetical protein
LRPELQRRGDRIVVRHEEGSAIGEDAGREPQAELADREQVALELHLG